MGSSKKHKEKDRESKKKRKHRSRSKSPQKERKRRHRDDDEREEGRSSAKRPYEYPDEDVADYRRENRHAEEAPSQGSGDGSSLSIEETNRLRAKLGLKPLDIPDSKGGDGESSKKSDSVHVPAVNMGQQKKTERLKEKLTTLKSKRELEGKLSRVKGLGDSDSDDDGAKAWVERSRKMQKERELADKRAKMLEEMDEDFGISGLVEQEFKKDTTQSYSSRDLTGLKVEHAIDKFSEGRNVILTLKDKGVLDEEEDDVLVNVNIEDDERAEKNVENKKKKPDYKPYDEPEYDEFGILKPTNLLEKYDEEIDGAKKESFTLSSGGHYDAAHEKRMAEIRKEMKAQLQTLSMAAPALANEYMTHEEMATFKKPKKKIRKIRKKEKMLTADDLLPLGEETSTEDYGSRSRGRGRVEVKEEGELDEVKGEVKMEVDESGSGTASDVKPEIMNKLKQELDDTDDIGPVEDLTGVIVEEEELQNELQGILAKTRKLKQKKDRKHPSEILNQIVSNTSQGESDEATNIILNSTSEFCRNLGEIPTYGLSGNRDEDRDELLDMELELMEQRRKEAEQEETTGGWNEVDIDENPVDIQAEEASVLEEEPIATDGVGSALKLAMKKGYLETEQTKKLPQISTDYKELQAQNYTIQDKRYDDLDEKNRKRERYSGGMITEFKEKEGYKPDVKLDYVDDSGRFLSAKEAFRQLSHRFHGKGSGKKKTEKRSKKVEEELLMKQMSSTDTPLNTLSLLQDKQKTEKSPYIVLSGSKGFTSNSIVKPS